MKFIDMNGDSLRYTGTPADVQSVVDVHNKDLGGFYNVSADNNGMVSISAGEGKNPSKMTKGQNAYYGALDRVINTTNGTTNINVTNNSSNVLIGDVLTSTIDIGDIQKLSPSSLPVTQGAALMHEVWEQYLVQNRKIDSRYAHIRANGIEKIIMGIDNIDPFRESLPRGSSIQTMEVKSNIGSARIYTKDNNPYMIIYPFNLNLKK